MRRVNRSAPWKGLSRARRAPISPCARCQKGGSRLHSASTEALLVEALAPDLSPFGADLGQDLHFDADLHLIEGGTQQLLAAKIIPVAVGRADDAEAPQGACRTWGS